MNLLIRLLHPSRQDRKEISMQERAQLIDVFFRLPQAEQPGIEHWDVICCNTAI